LQGIKRAEDESGVLNTSLKVDIDIQRKALTTIPSDVFKMDVVKLLLNYNRLPELTDELGKFILFLFTILHF